MQSSELGAARFGGNPGLGRGVAGEALGVARTRFGCSLAVGTTLVGGPGGGRWRRPRLLGIRRGEGWCKPTYAIVSSRET
jgi:hypothetical protein